MVLVPKDIIRALGLERSRTQYLEENLSRKLDCCQWSSAENEDGQVPFQL